MQRSERSSLCERSSLASASRELRSRVSAQRAKLACELRSLSTHKNVKHFCSTASRDYGANGRRPLATVLAKESEALLRRASLSGGSSGAKLPKGASLRGGLSPEGAVAPEGGTAPSGLGVKAPIGVARPLSGASPPRVLPSAG